MAVNKIWIEIEYQTENQTTIGTKGNRLTDSGNSKFENFNQVNQVQKAGKRPEMLDYKTLVPC